MTEIIPHPEAVPAPATNARPKTSFAIDVLKLASGTTLAQLLGILVSPILTRLYAPEAFGMLAIFTSITAIIGVIACLRYELPIMLPESDEEAANLLGASLMFAGLISLLTVPIIWWGGDTLLRWLNAPNLAHYLWLVPLAVLFTGIFMALNYWNSRTKQFGRLSIARVTTSVATITGQLGVGFAGFTTGGTLIGASVGGSMLATTVLGGQIWRDDKKIFVQSVRWHKMQEGIKRYHKFPLWGTWSALLGTASWQLPAFLLSVFFSSTIVGYYALGFRILQLPMSLIGGAIGQVFFQRTAASKCKGELAFMVSGAYQSLVILMLFPSLVLTMIGKDLFIVFFGVNWSEAGVFAQILAIWGFVWFVVSPLTNLHATLEMQEFGVIINIMRFFFRLAALTIGGWMGSPRLAIGLFAISGILIYAFQCVVLLRVSGVSSSIIVRSFRTPIILFTPVCAILLILKAFSVGGWIQVCVGIVGVIAYYLYSFRKEPSLKLLRELR